jgi:hypothetical protein
VLMTFTRELLTARKVDRLDGQLRNAKGNVYVKLRRQYGSLLNCAFAGMKRIRSMLAAARSCADVVHADD